jgi:hypothetical protein
LNQISKKSYWSIRKAIWIGHLMITVPCVLIFNTPLIITLREILVQTAPWWIIFLALVTGFVVSWLYWCYMVTVWRVLAYGKVKNIRGLKKKAIASFLIWPDNHWLAYAEIRNDSQRKKLRNYDRLLFARDLATNQPNDEDVVAKAPKSVDSHMNEKLNIVEVVFCLLLVLSGIYFFYEGDYYLALILLVFGIFGSLFEIRQLLNRKTFLSANPKGIETPETGLIAWKNINAAEVKEIRRGRRVNKYLYFTYAHALDNTIVLENYTELTEFDIDITQLQSVIDYFLKTK